MLAGPLNKRVWIQRPIDGQKSPGGAPVTTFTDWIEVWAAVEPLVGREFIAAQSVNADVNVRIRIRRRAGIDSTMRVRWLHGPGSPQTEELFDIQGPPIEPITNRVELWLMCKQRDTRGFRTGPR